MESILLSNIAAIIVKDVLIDDNKPKEETNKFSICHYPLLCSDSEDEALHFYLRQKRQKTQSRNFSVAPINTKTFKSDSTDNSLHHDHALHNTYNSTTHKSPLEINLINKFNSTAFEGHLHMSKITFLRIFKRLRQYLPNKHFPTAAPPQSIFSLALWKLSTDEHFEDICRKFNVTKQICQQVIRLFWRRISTQYESLIQWPSTPAKSTYTLQSFKTHPQLKKFPLLFGIIATKELDVFIETENEECKVVLQIICDGDQNVVDCFLALANDYSFVSSPIGQTLALNGQTLPPGSYLIGDESVPLKPYLIRPLGCPSNKREQEFNIVLHSALIIGQKVLDAMAKRFNALYALEARNIHEVRRIVDTICVLHNLCVEMEDDYVENKLKVTQSGWSQMTNNDGRKKPEDESNEQGRLKREALMAKIIG